MKIRVVAVGKLKEPHWRSAAEEYLKRLRPYARVEQVEVADRDLSADEPRAIAAEGADLLRVIGDAPHVVALSPQGRELTSEGFAARIAELTNDGRSDITFVIGGAGGISDEVLRRADDTLAVSRMTLPHQMCRVLLLEQVYRAFRIIRHEPYHR